MNQTLEKPRVRLDHNAQALVPIEKPKSSARAFTFGEPEPALGNNITDYLGVFASSNERYYVPPVSLTGLAKTFYSNGTHATAVEFKQMQLLGNLKDNLLITKTEARLAIADYLVFKNAYFLAIRNRLGGINRYVRMPAINMRVGTDNNFFLLTNQGDELEYKANDVLHLNGGDIRQSIYGIPTYFSGIQSILLGEAATLYRRKYYINGAHSGYIMVTFDLENDQADELQNAISQTKGPGNHRSLYLNMESTIGGKPGYTKDRVQIIPVGDFGNKDEYDKIKEVTMQDILNMHRVPAALASIMPLNNATHGDLKSIREVYYDCETLPAQAIWTELNDRLPSRGKIAFNEPRWLKERTV